MPARFQTGLVALAMLAAVATSAVAQTAEPWPTKPVRLFIPVGAGGAAETLARTLAKSFGTHFDVAIWHGIVGPAGMDTGLVKRTNAVFNAVLKDAAVQTAIREGQAAEIIGGTPEQFDAFIKDELKRWPEVMKAAGAEVK